MRVSLHSALDPHVAIENARGRATVTVEVTDKDLVGQNSLELEWYTTVSNQLVFTKTVYLSVKPGEFDFEESLKTMTTQLGDKTVKE